MNKTASEAVRFVRELATTLPKDPAVETVLAPPFTALESVRGVLGSASHIALGGQNLHWEQQGAFTGEISGPMLRDLGCTYVIVGHSERRALFGERLIILWQSRESPPAAVQQSGINFFVSENLDWEMNVKLVKYLKNLKN